VDARASALTCPDRTLVVGWEAGQTPAVPREWVRLLLIVLAVAVALSIAGYVLFNIGGDAPPRTGTGETITGLTTP
jgi:hypothetical protein